MANIITNLNGKRNAWNNERGKVNKKPPKVHSVGDLTIKEQTTKTGNKMHVVTDKNEGTDKADKERYIRRTYGDNPTKNGHGTVVTVGDADK